MQVETAFRSCSEQPWISQHNSSILVYENTAGRNIAVKLIDIFQVKQRFHTAL